MPFASALSVHPVAATAVGEAAGQVLETLGPAPDLVALFVTPHHGGALEDVARAVRAILQPTVLFGCAAVSVLGVRHEVEDEPGVSLWAARFADGNGEGNGDRNGERQVAPARFPGTGPEPPFDPSALLLVGDPYSFDAEALYETLAGAYPGLPVIGGNASAAFGPGGNRLVLDDLVTTDGAVGAFLGPGAHVTTVVSQGCRPIGNPYVVTKSERNVIYELAGRPALERLLEMARSGAVPEEDVRLINQGLHLGQVIDEHKDTFGPGDFLVRNVLGADQEVGAVAVGAEVELGQTVQFHVRDARTADEDLRLSLDGHGDANGALLFTCNGRGRRLFGQPDHDAEVFDERVGAPVAGFFAAGEFGPVGGRNFVHGFTASMALFSDR
jgi:small ligand-binding sensory domain FIST